ncbi:MAG TPA: TldD/PmbA family protein, partial [Candidatus Methylomirabilis sp.]|nr:TldD/PmbA family protein [Candidatus Methylomirabilis sp.]
MPQRIEVDLIDRVQPLVRELVASRARGLAHLSHADIRVAVTEGRFASAENGAPRASGENSAFAFGIRVLAGHRAIAPGYFGRVLGTADIDRLADRLGQGLLAAHRRAVASAEMKADVRDKFGSLGEALADTRLCPVPIARAVVPPVFEVDPRAVGLDEMARLAAEVSREVAALVRIEHNHVAATTQLSRELFASSEGALVDQSFALTQGMCHVVASGDGNRQELYDVMGHQRGWEVLRRGVDESLMAFPPFLSFALALARDAAE